MNFKTLGHKDLVHFIAQHPKDEKAWREFCDRFHQHICQTVGNEVRSRQHPEGMAVTEDLVQEVYKKLVDKNCEALRVFHSPHDNGIFSYLQVISIRVVLNDLTRKSASKRPPPSKKQSVDADMLDKIFDSENWLDQIKLFELIEEVKFCLKKIIQESRHGRRDHLIFRYYLLEELKPEEIALLVGVGLSAKRVINIIGAVRKDLRGCLKKML